MTLAKRKQEFVCLSQKVEVDGKEVTRFDRDFLGKRLTVEYAEISKKTGKPLQPKAIAVRTYEDPNTDPVKKMYEECNLKENGGSDCVTPFDIEQLDTAE